MNILSNDNNFTYIDENGNKIICDILCDLETKEKNYLIYTDNTKYKDGSKKIYASSYIIDDSKKILESINTEEEWNMIEAILSYLTKEN
ncbi:MAG: DUF1292 domain-containing protein [Bacilli bacterium]|nr:DUF1292 domain-containing protein [Bacilli bacterium]